MALLGMGAFDPMGLVFALIELSDRDQGGVDRVRDRGSVGTGQPGSPGREPIDQALGGVSVTTAALLVNQVACSAIRSLPEFVGRFFK